jgi:hypothetical protein
LYRRADPDYQEQGAQSKLYCVNGHPLFGENMHLVQMANGGYRRYCRACRRDAVARHVNENRKIVIAAKADRRIVRIAERREKNRQAMFDLVDHAKNLPDMVVFRTLGRLMRDFD